MCFRRYDNLKFPYTYNGKIESMPLFLSHCGYFVKSFTEMFLQKSSTTYINFVQLLNLIGCHGNKSAKLRKNILKASPQDPQEG